VFAGHTDNESRGSQSYHIFECSKTSIENRGRIGASIITKPKNKELVTIRNSIPILDKGPNKPK
jgi:hypothetical protein